jgi:uncharacterized protein YggE
MIRHPAATLPLAALPLAALLLAVPVAAVLLAPAAQAETPRHLTVTGEGRIEVTPDMALVTIGVRTQAKTAQAALAANSERMAAVLAQLRAAGIAPRDLQTGSLSLGPRYEYHDNRAPRLVGFEASNEVTARVRALDSLGAVLDAAVADGANVLGGLTFTLADPGPARDAALAGAVREARRKAEIMAGAAGVALGPVVSIAEAGGFAPPLPMPRMAMEAAAVPIEAGEIAYAASVTVVWALAD